MKPGPAALPCLVLDDAARAAIVAHARETYPEECCGLLVGTRRIAPTGPELVVDKVMPAANVAAERRQDRFELDPALHLRVQRELRGTDRAVIGHYHSHPDGRAEPSAIDRANIHDPTLAWVIVALNGDETEIAAFYPEGGDLCPVMLLP